MGYLRLQINGKLLGVVKGREFGFLAGYSEREGAGCRLMVSLISSGSNGERDCPALDKVISQKVCGEGRITSVPCPLSCQHNPFNPNAPKAFDQVLMRGLTKAARWVEKEVGQGEWARRFDAMDRRFHPERDLPLISFEAQWAVLAMSRNGEAYPELWESFTKGSGLALRNDARIVIEKLAASRVLLLEVVIASNELPYYTCRDMLEPDNEYLYVDFGDQDPLKKGTVMLGRFLAHENCIYVIPGVFLGSPSVLANVLVEVENYLGSQGVEAATKMQGLLPEIWNVCAEVQEELGDDDYKIGNPPPEGEEPEEFYKATSDLPMPRAEVIARLRENELFFEENAPDFGFDPLVDTVFRIRVLPPEPPLEDDELDDLEESLSDEEKTVTVGTVFVGGETLAISGMNPVELELIKALVMAVLRN